MLPSFTRSAMWLLAGEALLLAAIVLSFLHLSEAKAAFRDSSHNQQLCQQLASEIESLRNMASVADEGEADSTIDGSRIIQLAQDCGITESQVTSIQQPVPIQIDGTDYQRKDISPSLRGVTIKQVIKLALEVEKLGGSAKVTSIQFNSNSQSRRNRKTTSDAKSVERWNADLTLTQLIYAARSANR